MKEKRLTPTEAWNEFWSNYMANKPASIPNELRVADLTNKGRLDAQWGKTKDGISKGEVKKKKLGPLRIRRLLDKYAPGQYDFHEGSPYFTKPKNKTK